MKTYTDSAQFSGISKPILTTGTFDGVHLGHRVILKRVVELAEKNGGEATMLSFFPHPRMVLYPDDHGLQLLSTPGEKERLLADCGIQHHIVQPFTEAFARLSVTEYIRGLLVRSIGVHTVVVGYDHHFGRNREGDFKDLVEFSEIYNFAVEEIPAWQIQDVNVSSTKIREALHVGDVARANSYLGYTYGVQGSVVRGQQLGRTLGIPTANLQPEFSWKLIPAGGVYAGKVFVEGRAMDAVINIGRRPTVDSDGEQTIEAHVLGQEIDLYDKHIRLEFEHRLRDERTFSDVNALKEQILQDIQQAKSLFAL